jgi:hypothetical protein
MEKRVAAMNIQESASESDTNPENTILEEEDQNFDTTQVHLELNDDNVDTIQSAAVAGKSFTGNYR